jgi:hypothetical protein
MYRNDDELEEIEAMVWRTGTRDRMLVRRIMARVSTYGITDRRPRTRTGPPPAPPRPKRWLRVL